MVIIIIINIYSIKNNLNNNTTSGNRICIILKRTEARKNTKLTCKNVMHVYYK